MYRYAVPVVVLFALFVTACAAEPPTPDISATVAAIGAGPSNPDTSPNLHTGPASTDLYPCAISHTLPYVSCLTDLHSPPYAPAATDLHSPPYAPAATDLHSPPYAPAATDLHSPPYAPATTDLHSPPCAPAATDLHSPPYAPATTDLHSPPYADSNPGANCHFPYLRAGRPSQQRPTATPDDWSGTGAWYRDRELEEGVTAFVKAQGLDQDVRFATLDATPTALFNAISLTVGCIGGTKVAYFAPYTFSVPVEIDIYAIGIWDDSTGSWKEGELHYYSDPVLTDDGSAIYVVNQVQVSQIFSIIQNAVQLQNSHQVLNAGDVR